MFSTCYLHTLGYLKSFQKDKNTLLDWRMEYNVFRGIKIFCYNSSFMKSVIRCLTVWFLAASSGLEGRVIWIVEARQTKQSCNLSVKSHFPHRIATAVKVTKAWPYLHESSSATSHWTCWISLVQQSRCCPKRRKLHWSTNNLYVTNKQNYEELLSKAIIPLLPEYQFGCDTKSCCPLIADIKK